MIFKKKPLPVDDPNRRRHDRVAIKIPVVITTQNGEVIRCEIEDLSLGGVLLRSPVPLNPRDKITLEFRFAATRTIMGGIVEVDEVDKKAPMRATESAEIRWGKEDGTFGIQFSELSAETQRFLKKLVKYCEELKKE